MRGVVGNAIIIYKALVKYSILNIGKILLLQKNLNVGNSYTSCLIRIREGTKLCGMWQSLLLSG
jgi:hypothetical protein